MNQDKNDDKKVPKAASRPENVEPDVTEAPDETGTEEAEEENLERDEEVEPGKDGDGEADDEDVDPRKQVSLRQSLRAAIKPRGRIAAANKKIAQSRTNVAPKAKGKAKAKASPKNSRKPKASSKGPPKPKGEAKAKAKAKASKSGRPSTSSKPDEGPPAKRGRGRKATRTPPIGPDGKELALGQQLQIWYGWVPYL